MYKNCQCANLDNAEGLKERSVNMPSSVRIALQNGTNL